MTQPLDRNGSAQYTTDQPSAQLPPARPHSIKIDRNAKGEPSWEIKLYFGPDESPFAINEQMIGIDADLRAHFQPAWATGRKA